MEMTKSVYIHTLCTYIYTLSFTYWKIYPLRKNSLLSCFCYDFSLTTLRDDLSELLEISGICNLSTENLI